MSFSLDVTDEELAREAVFDQAAFAELYRRYANNVYRYLLSRVGNVQDAQDLSAQTFLAAFENIESYRGEGRFMAWLLSIAWRKSADHFRRSKHVVSLEYIQESPHPDPSPDETVGQRLQMEQVMDGLSRIAPDRAEALKLRIFGGLKASEIAELMNRSEAAVKMLIHRALQDLRQQLNTLAMDEV